MGTRTARLLLALTRLTSDPTWRRAQAEAESWPPLLTPITPDQFVVNGYEFPIEVCQLEYKSR